MKKANVAKKKRTRKRCLAQEAASRRQSQRSWPNPSLLWLLPLGVFLFQGLVTWGAMHQLRYEELAESVRNVYWLGQGKIYDGVSSNVGWYGTLLAFYEVFGFGLNSAKFVRLGLHFVSLLCLWALLRRWMGERAAWLPLLAVGLSPVLLYFNTLQTSFGLDLQYLPICLLFVFSSRGTTRGADLARTAACWGIAMIAAMSYPTFLFYLPSLLVLHLWWIGRQAQGALRRSLLVHAAVGAAAFALPLVTALLAMESPGMLLHDPAVGAGLFRGGGKLNLSPGVVGEAFSACLRDLFVRGDSYYFELRRPDLGGVLSWISVAFALGVLGRGWSRGETPRWPLLAILLAFLLALVLPAISSKGYPGLRRCTGLLAALYAMHAMAWRCFSAAFFKRRWHLWTGAALFLLLPLHHLWAFHGNYQDRGKPSKYRYSLWFDAKGDPEASLDHFLRLTGDRGLPLKCLDQQRQPVPCRYSEIFGALAGYRRWNGLDSPPIRAYDWKRGKIITLSTELWDRYYFSH